MRTKDKMGLYFCGILIANNYRDAVKELFQLNEISRDFLINEDHNANGYSIIDCNGVQHIYEISPAKFYESLMNLN